MKYLLQIDFPYNGPFYHEFFESMKDLAEDIATEEGLVYKLWTENEKTKEAGGIYVFDNLNDANRYLEKHTKRLESFGFTDIKAKTFKINEELSAICKASFY
ncbi:monooxygenase [Psychrobacter frigidicola]|uniref:monooxygenase n=1 Tax=Psychrobacter frigidicola TaxID=45611 RepID=UPI00191A5608|nr:monooxygenase [Psychrobacter frigidicola]